MAITYFASSANPIDNGSLTDAALRSITPPASMVAGDLVRLLAAVKSSTETLAISQAGGQTWTSETLRQGGQLASRVFWCRFNGTWTADPSVATTNQAGLAFSLKMDVFRPTSGTNTWAIDVAEASAHGSAPVSPFDVTATVAGSSVAASTVTLVDFVSADNNNWALQSGGYTNAGGAQYGNHPGNDISLSSAYKILTSAGTRSNCVNRQTANGGDATRWHAITLKEQSSGLTIADAGDELYYNGETGIVITGTSFGASQGAGFVKISPTDNIADGSAVSQTVTAWSDTSITMTAVNSAFTPFAQAYLFVQSNAGQSNSSGRQVKRERRMQITLTLKSLPPTSANQASLTGIEYEVRAGDAAGAVVQDGVNASTNGSGVMALPNVALAEASPLAGGGDVYVDLFYQGANQAASLGGSAQLTPTYL